MYFFYTRMEKHGIDLCTSSKLHTHVIVFMHSTIMICVNVYGIENFVVYKTMFFTKMDEYAWYIICTIW